MSLKISLIIPIYNEEANILQLYNEIKSSESYTMLNKIIFIDDCSTDDSQNVIKKILKIDNKIHLISQKNNYGQSYSILSGCKSTDDNIIATIDGDCQNDPDDLSKLINTYKLSEAKLVSGIRLNRKDSILKKFSSYIANQIRKKILDDDCVDTGCSLKVFDKKIFLNFPYFNGIHRFLPALFKGYGYKCEFISVNHRFRLHGYSKYGTMKRLILGIRDTMMVKKIIKKKE